MMMYWEKPKKTAENSSKTTSSFRVRINAINASLVYSRKMSFQLTSLGLKGRPHWRKSF